VYVRRVLARGSKLIAGLVLFAVQFFFLSQVTSAAADTCTWTGAVSANWSNGGNWTGCDNGNVPQAGDNLLFPDSGSNHTMTNDTVVTYNNITFALGSTYSVTFNTVALSGSFNVFGTITALNPSVRFIASSGTPTLNIQNGSIPSSTEVEVFVSGSAVFNVFTTNSSVTLPFFDGFTTSFNLIGNPTDPIESYTSSATSSSFTASDGVHIQRAGFTCAATNCLGNDANAIYLDGSDASGDAYLRFDKADLVFPNQIDLMNANGMTGELQMIFLQDATLSGQLVIGNTSFIVVGDGVTSTISGNTIIGASTQMQGAGDYTTSVLNLTGPIGGSGTIYTADAHVIFAGDNTSYTGTINVEGSSVAEATRAESFGDDSGPTNVASGSTALINSGSDIGFFNEPLTIAGTGVGGSYNGALVNQGEYVALREEVTLSGDATITNNAPVKSMVFVGKITGAFSPTFTGSGNGIVLVNTSDNDYTGTTYVNGMRLFLSDSDNVIKIPHDAVVTATPSKDAYIISQAEEQIADAAKITINSDTSVGGFAVSGGHTETVGTVEGDGLIDLGSSSDTLRIGGGNVSGTFTGQILSANGSIQKIGTGTWNMQGTNEDLGSGFASFEVAEGTFLANFANTSGAFSSFGVTGGTLGGSDIIGPTHVYSGTIAPGNSPGCLNPDGDVVMSSDATLTIQLAGTTICSQYDKLAASGVVSLNNATLLLNPSFTPTVGDVFTIVEGSSVDGTFNGLPNGATVTASGLRFRINYSSNNVTLTYLGGSLTSTSSSLAVTGQNWQLYSSIASVLLLAGTAAVFFHRRKLT
jgi:hypothetical protein